MAKKEPAGLVELSEESSASNGEESSVETAESLPEESPKLERGDKTRDKTPAKTVERTPAKPENRGRGRETEKSGHGRGREPEKKASEKGRGKSKSKSEKGRRACPVCWQMGVDTQAGMEQHQYWSVPCNAWKRHNQGESWEDALAKAERQKERRTARWNAQGTASASKPEAPKKEGKKKAEGSEGRDQKKEKEGKGHWHQREEGQGEEREEEGVLLPRPTPREERNQGPGHVFGLRGQRKRPWPWKAVDQGVALGEDLKLTAVRKPAAAGIYKILLWKDCLRAKAEGLKPAGRRNFEKPAGLGNVQRVGPGIGIGLTHLLFLGGILYSHNKKSQHKVYSIRKNHKTLLFKKTKGAVSHCPARELPTKTGCTLQWHQVKKRTHLCSLGLEVWSGRF